MTTPCPGCRAAMQRLVLQAHYGRTVEVDLCAGCHMLWFDDFESVNLSGRGVLQLLRAIDAAHGSAHAMPAQRLDCPRCGSALRHVHNLTTLGRSAHHECPRRHGTAQSFALYLGEKGFVRPLLRPELAQLRSRPEDRQPFHCINCGGQIDPRRRETCTYCAAPVRVIDVLALMRAVDRQARRVGEAPGAGGPATQRSFACAHCGAPVNPTQDRGCRSCAMPVAITDLKWALAWIEPLLPVEDEEERAAQYRARLAAIRGSPPH